MPNEPKKKKPRKPYKQPWPSATPLPPFRPSTPPVHKPSAGIGMRMNFAPAPVPQPAFRMEMQMGVGDYQQQKQIMTLSPRIRTKPLSEQERNALFRFEGVKIPQEDCNDNADHS